MSAAEVTPAAAAQRAPLHTISLFVNNKPGVLVRVALVFSRRGFNIESLVVSAGAEGRFSRMTIVCSGAADALGQIIQQLSKLIDVVHAIIRRRKCAFAYAIAACAIACSLCARYVGSVDRCRYNASPIPATLP